MGAHNFTAYARALGLAATLWAGSTYADYEGLGRHLTKEELAGWNIDIAIDGKGLPPGQGTVMQGEKVYQTMCLACHGSQLEGGLGPALAGGKGSLATAKPLKTIGSYWPYATTLFDYIRRAMPFQSPQSMSHEDIYSVTAYLLYKNEIVSADAKLDASNLAAVKMPNRDNFYVDDRPDAKNPRCMKDCLQNEQ
ncbi:c-type cytochrome [Achromobacter aegrifaciens]|uniref:Cytochrome c n=1 Tax=Achromobacter aegrifaciens TaxID=1287736 RepID=A0AAD2J4L8_ACHAE|nr:cytochrome c [Achromobacter aegrifaciens]CUJ68822.1 Cytochrome c [Achromobacter aegrifaciens]